MGAAGEAGVEAADARLDPVEQGLRNLHPRRHRIGDVGPGDLMHGAIHRQVVLTGGDDQIHLGQQAVVVDAVVVEQGAPRRFTHPHRLMVVEAGAAAHAAMHQLRILSQGGDRLQTGDDLHQPRMVIGETRDRYLATALAEFRQFPVSPGGADLVADIETRQRAHPVHAVGIAKRPVVGELQVTPGLHRLRQKAGVVVLPQAIGHDRAVTGAKAQLAIEVLPQPLRRHQAHEQAGEGAEQALLLLQGSIEQAFVQLQGQADRRLRFRQTGQNPVPRLGTQRRAHPTGHRPGGMNLAATKQLQNLLTELTQTDAGAGQLRIGRHQPEEVAASRIALPAQQEIGTAEMEKRQGVALGDLGQVEQAPQLQRRRRDLHRQQLVAGLGRRQQMAHRADAADAGGDAGHLGERPPFAEGFEAAILHHMETAVDEMAVIVELQRDLGVTLNPGDRINHDSASHQPNLSISGPSMQGLCPSSSGAIAARMRSAEGGQPGR